MIHLGGGGVKMREKKFFQQKKLFFIELLTIMYINLRSKTITKTKHVSTNREFRHFIKA